MNRRQHQAAVPQEMLPADSTAEELGDRLGAQFCCHEDPLSTTRTPCQDLHVALGHIEYAGQIIDQGPRLLSRLPVAR